MHGMTSTPRSPPRLDEPQKFTRREQLKFEEEETLVSALREQIRNERELEDAKIRLAGQADFNLMDAF